MSSNFENKKKMLFDCLNSAELCIQGTSLDQKQFSRDEPMQRDQAKTVFKGKRFSGKESIFKRPEAPISKCLRPRRVPDYQMNPHKWKKYSLDEADISDKSNASAAFAFLAEMERRKDAEEDRLLHESEMGIDDKLSGKILFKKQNTSKVYRKPSFNQSTVIRKEIENSNKCNESDDKAILKGSKLVMPEYVIGQKLQKKNRSIRKIDTESTAANEPNAKSDGNNRPHLQHLFDNEEEEDDD